MSDKFRKPSIIEFLKKNKVSHYIITKIGEFLSFFHITTILGHDKLSSDKNENLDSNFDSKQELKKTNGEENLKKSLALQKIEGGFNKVIQGFDNVYSKHDKEENEVRVLRDARGPLKIGLYIIFAFFGILFSWLVFAKIDGSVVAQGQVVFAQNKQNVQHQSGGIIKSILVKEGDFVHYGQVLMTMHDSDLRANYNIAYNKVFSFKANQARMIAERDNLEELRFEETFIKDSEENKDLREILVAQQRLFKADIELFKNRIQIIRDRSDQLRSDIKSVESQKVLLKQRIAYIEEQITNTEKLLIDGNVSKIRLLDLKSQRDALMQEEQRLSGAVSNYQGQIMNLAEEEMVMKNNRFKEIADVMRDLEANTSLEQERVNALQESLNKDVIKASVDGIINNLKYKNSGEVVQSGAVIMEIVPNDDYLVIEAKLMAKEINSLLNTGLDLFNYNHQDINHLLDAKINLLSYSNRRYKKLRGSVFYVAPDIMTDPRYGFTYYLLKVMVSKKELEYAATKNMKLFPGMPAEIYVLTEPRTPFSYLISPITASMDKAFIDS